jgi:hypothetical protein
MTLLLPRDRDGLMGLASRTWFDPDGFSTQRLLQLIHEYYAVSYNPLSIGKIKLSALLFHADWQSVEAV